MLLANSGRYVRYDPSAMSNTFTSYVPALIELPARSVATTVTVYLPTSSGVIAYDHELTAPDLPRFAPPSVKVAASLLASPDGR